MPYGLCNQPAANFKNLNKYYKSFLLNIRITALSLAVIIFQENGMGRLSSNIVYLVLIMSLAVLQC